MDRAAQRRNAMTAHIQHFVSPVQVASPGSHLSGLRARLSSLKLQISRFASARQEQDWDPETESFRPRHDDGSSSPMLMHPMVIAIEICGRR
jgi:hypothetical protein